MRAETHAPRFWFTDQPPRRRIHADNQEKKRLAAFEAGKSAAFDDDSAVAVPAKGILGSKWVGFQQFRYVFRLPTFLNVIQNTFFIACAKIILTLICTVSFALLLNEVRNRTFKKLVQTITYLPHFLSWVILGGIFVDILSPSSGFVNQFLKLKEFPQQDLSFSRFPA